MHPYYTSKSSRLDLKLEVCYISGVSNVSGIKKVLKISRRTRMRLVVVLLLFADMQKSFFLLILS